jgi:prolyl oligopeptidase
MTLAARLRAALAAVVLAASLAHGEDAADPLRFLEDLSRPETRAFLREQGEAARSVLDRLSGRAALAERIHALSASATSISSLALAAGRVFYLRRAPGEANASLCMREGLGGAERVLVDPERFSEPGRRASIDWIAPSPDGRRVAYGVARGGSEESVLRVADADTSRDLPLEIDRARFAERLAWEPDSSAFYYARHPESGEGARRYATIRVYRHVLGRDTARDEIVFAPGVGGARDVPEFSYPSLLLPLESRYAYAIVREGARREIAVHAAERRDLASGRPAWRKIVAFEDQVTAIEAWKDDLFVLSHREAPRSRVLRFDPRRDIGSAKVAVPQGDAIIESMALARDALYLRTQLGGVDRLERLQIGLLGTKPADYVKIPFDTAITQLVSDPRRPGAILAIEGWIEPPAVVEVEAKTGNLRNTGIAPPARVDYTAMDEVRLYAIGHDGTSIPVTLIYRKTTQLTGSNPTLLVAYGSHGESMKPAFDPARLAWLERGGIYAVAHVRGGGEYGEAWHQAGSRGAKINTVLDFISVAEYLVSYGFTSPARLAIMGTGAGAIPVGGALARRSDRYAAVVLRAPLVDLLGYESMPEGPMEVPELGSAATPQGAERLRVISALHQLKDAAPYPAVLLSVGLNDLRVLPWQAARMAARLQATSTSGKPVLLRVDAESGHGRGTPRDRRDEELADIYSFLLWQFGEPQFRPAAN